MEMREDIEGLKATVDAIAKDQALGVEPRASMQRSADSIYARLDGHDRDLDRMLAWQNRADGKVEPATRRTLSVSAVAADREPFEQASTNGSWSRGGRSCRSGSCRRPTPTAWHSRSAKG